MFWKGDKLIIADNTCKQEYIELDPHKRKN